MPKTYRRDIIILFIGKLILLIGLFWVCFSPKHRPFIDASEMTNLILNTEEKTPHARP
jgi:cbb3-type cytochrome oxidase subunit 3